MSEFKTYRVRVCEDRCLAINVSARNADDACDLAGTVYAHIGGEPFEVLDSVVNNTTFEAEEISGADLPSEPQTPSHAKDGPFNSMKNKRRSRGTNL